MTTITPAPVVQRPTSLPVVWRSRIRAFVRLALTRHLGISLLVLTGAALRILVMAAYQPALWFNGDSGAYIRHAKQVLPTPDAFRPAGYMLFLKTFGPTQTLSSVAAAQHLMGLAVALAVYLLLQRRGLPRWLSCLAVVPLLFDSLQVTIEHFILVESLFTTILLAAFLLLLWQREPSTLVCIVVGVLLFGAWFTKPLALPTVPIIVTYLLTRRLGWHKVVGFVAAFLIPYGIVQVLVSGQASVYGSNSSALYGRAASIADCDRIELTEEQRVLCPTAGQRGMRPDWYVWAEGAPGAPFRGKSSAYPNMRSFAISVIRQQPNDYARQVGKETAAHFIPGVDLGWSFWCLRERYSLPATAYDTKPLGLQCHPQMAGGGFDDKSVPSAHNPSATPLTTVLAVYSRVVRTSPVVVSVAFLLTCIALFVRRPEQWNLRGDAGLLIVASATLIILPVVIGMYEARYALPALPLACIAGALSVRPALYRRRTHHPATETGQTTEEAEAHLSRTGRGSFPISSTK